jgi:hypothetical protein
MGKSTSVKIKRTECIAKNAGTGSCSTWIPGSKFCTKHHGQHMIGIIDGNGVKLREKHPESYKHCQAVNSFDTCTNRNNGRFCSRHDYQFRVGLIDAVGNKLREKYCTKIYHSCVGAKSGTTCSPPWEKGRFCRRHYAHYRYGIIDYNGNKLRDLKKHHTQSKNRLQYERTSYKIYPPPIQVLIDFHSTKKDGIQDVQRLTQHFDISN